MILPTILFIVSSDQITSMNRLIDDKDAAGDGTEEESEEETDEAIPEANE